ncbi:protein disulfide isomerase [Diplonema papillatum]|nr:protein disulfide isomerase [Diplonema papillatum]
MGFLAAVVLLASSVHLVPADVRMITPEEYTSVTESGDKIWIVMFTVARCSYCQQTLGTWRVIARKAKSVPGDPLELAVFDAMLPKATNIVRRLGITRYPTFVLVHRNHTKRAIEGAQTGPSLLQEFIRNETGIDVIADAQEVKQGLLQHQSIQKPELSSKAPEKTAEPTCTADQHAFVEPSNIVLSTVDVRAALQRARLDSMHAGAERPAKLDENADIVNNSLKALLVLFQVTWCNPCRKARAELEVLLRDEVANIFVAVVDAASYPEVAQRYNIAEFPTIAYFPPGSNDAELITGRIDQESLRNFLVGKGF